MDQIRIVAAAVKCGKLVISLPAPARHSDIMSKLWDAFNVSAVPPSCQGFLDNRGGFRERVQAKVIARDAGQLLDRASDLSELFSEDVW